MRQERALARRPLHARPHSPNAPTSHLAGAAEARTPLAVRARKAASEPSPRCVQKKSRRGARTPRKKAPQERARERTPGTELVAHALRASRGLAQAPEQPPLGVSARARAHERETDVETSSRRFIVFNRTRAGRKHRLPSLARDRATTPRHRPHTHTSTPSRGDAMSRAASDDMDVDDRRRPAAGRGGGGGGGAAGRPAPVRGTLDAFVSRQPVVDDVVSADYPVSVCVCVCVCVSVLSLRAWGGGPAPAPRISAKTKTKKCAHSPPLALPPPLPRAKHTKKPARHRQGDPRAQLHDLRRERRHQARPPPQPRPRPQRHGQVVARVRALRVPRRRAQAARARRQPGRLHPARHDRGPRRRRAVRGQPGPAGRHHRARPGRQAPADGRERRDRRVDRELVLGRPQGVQGEGRARDRGGHGRAARQPVPVPPAGQGRRVCAPGRQAAARGDRARRGAGRAARQARGAQGQGDGAQRARGGESSFLRCRRCCRAVLWACACVVGGVPTRGEQGKGARASFSGAPV